MTDLEKLAQWHEERANLDWIPTRAKDHTAAAATIRTAMEEIERSRTADVILRQHYDVGWHNGLTEGERRATAAIVAYLRKARGEPAYYRVCMEVDNLRNYIEAGHHLPRDAFDAIEEYKPALTARAAYDAASKAYNAILAAQEKETDR